MNGNWSRTPSTSATTVQRYWRSYSKPRHDAHGRSQEGNSPYSPEGVDGRGFPAKFDPATRASPNLLTGRSVCFVPDVGEEFFSQDDAHSLVGMLHIGPEALEWRLTSPERVPGTGLYDTGAV